MNKVWKVLLPLVLVMALLTASLPAFAAESSPTTKAIGKVTVAKSTYNAKEQAPTVKVYDTDGKKISPRYYKVKVTGTPKNAGKYKVTVTAKAPYTGKKTATFVIKKAANPFTIKVGKTTFMRNAKKNQTTKIVISGVKGAAKVTKFSSSRYVYVKGSKIIVKRGFSGTATIMFKSTASRNYKATTKSVKITVKK